MSKTKKRICKQCGIEFEILAKSRSQYCSDSCRGAQNRDRCLRHYYNVIKPGLVKSGAIKPPPEKVYVKIKIKEPLVVYDEFTPEVGGVYVAEKKHNAQYEDQTIYIITGIGKYGLIVRGDECEELHEEDVIE